MADRIQLEVGGQMFTVSAQTLQNGHPSRLTKMCLSEDLMLNSSCVLVDRPSEMFAAILALYQTGELHIPMASCPGAFLKELEFWEISPEMISGCCFNRLQSFLTEQATFRQFKRNLEQDKADVKDRLSSCGCFGKLRSKLWSVIGYTQPSFIGRVYFVLSLFMVLLSIFTLAYSTDPSFQRRMTNCERLQYMDSTSMEDYDLVKKRLEQYCHDDSLPEHLTLPRNTVSSVELSEELESENLFTEYIITIEDDIDTVEFSSDYDVNDFNTNSNYTVQKSTENATHADLSTTPSENLPSPLYTTLFTENKPRVKRVKLPNMKVKIYTLVVLESITMAYFTFDFILRIFSCPYIGRYFLSVINTSDALALVGSYLHMLVVHTSEHEHYENGWTAVLEYSQMLRSFRLFRIVANVRAGKVLAFTIKSNIKDLSVLILFLIAGMCTFASCFFITEDKTNVPSIPDGWYWAIVTMTTVGYGDMYPRTCFGRFIGCICAITGMIVFALTVPIFANNFLTLYQLADSEHIKKLQITKTQPDDKNSAMNMPPVCGETESLETGNANDKVKAKRNTSTSLQ